MTIEELRKFCGSSEYEQYGINHPFSRDDYTYSTDGHICIRVPVISEVTHKAKDTISEGAEKLFLDVLKRESVWQDLPPFELEMDDCRECSGHGYVKTCPAFDNPQTLCSAAGENTLCEQYSYDCTKGCKADDKGAFKCEDCYGVGKVKLPGNYVVHGSKGQTRISAIYLDMIKDLPNVKIAPYDEKSHFAIRFDGGEGVLMPMLLEANS